MAADAVPKSLGGFPLNYLTASQPQQNVAGLQLVWTFMRKSPLFITVCGLALAFAYPVTSLRCQGRASNLEVDRLPRQLLALRP